MVTSLLSKWESKMKKLLLTGTCLVMLTVPALAEQRTQVYNRDGKHIGSKVTQKDGTEIYYDTKGNPTGKIVCTFLGVDVQCPKPEKPK
jgi:hypothetical protein